MSTGFITGHVIYNLAYDYKFQLKTTPVSELMKHIRVDSYGHCLHNTDLPSSLRNPTVNNFSVFIKSRKKIEKIFFRVFIKVSLKAHCQKKFASSDA